MYEKFKFERIALSLIDLDRRNPRIVTQAPLSNDNEILRYFFEHEGLSQFTKMIAAEGRNPGAERPYVVKQGKRYTVIEGNTRVAAYKLLTGQLVAPTPYENTVPSVSQEMKDELLSVDVTIAPSRDALLAIMARAHFGRGDKSRWGYLGSRKAVYDDWKSGKSIAALSHAFGRTQGQVRDLLLEYELYLEALKLAWTPAERDALLKPSVEFNPPVRFLQTTGHRQQVGVELDKTNISVDFTASDSKAKFKHLVKRTVIDDNGPSATASYDVVFANFATPSSTPSPTKTGASSTRNTGSQNSTNAGSQPGSSSPSGSGATTVTNHGGVNLKSGALFNYPLKRNDLTLSQLMKEARGLNTKTYPGAGTALLRGIIELLLKLIVEEKGLNPQNKLLDIEGALNLVVGNGGIPQDDQKVLKEFRKNHIEYANLSTHATVTPNYNRLIMMRDCVDGFVRRNI